MSYTLRGNTGCVVETFEAIQFLGDPDVVRTTFPHLTIFQANANGALTVTDNRNTYLVLLADWIVVDGGGFVVVLSDENFKSTYADAGVDV